MRVATPIAAHEKRERHSPGTLPNQAFRASPAPRGHRPPSGGKFELLQPRARRKGVLWAPLDELRAPVLLSTNELLWLPRSPDPRPAMGRAEKATRTSPVSEQVRSRCFCAHFLHSNRAVAVAHAKNSAAASGRGPSNPLLSFWPRARRNKAPFLLVFATLLSFCPSFPAAAPDQQQLQAEAEREQGEQR